MQVRLTRRGRWWTLGTGTSGTMLSGICALIGLGVGAGIKALQEYLSKIA